MEKEFMHKQSIAAGKVNTDQLIEQLKEAQLAQLMGNMTKPKPSVILANGTDVEDILAPLSEKIDEALRTLAASKEDTKVADELRLSFNEFAKAISKYVADNQKSVEKAVSNMETAIKDINIKPVVNVPSPKVNVAAPELDIKPLIDQVKKLEQTISAISNPVIDTTDLIISVNMVKESIDGLRFPVPNYVLPYKDANGEATQANVDANGNIQVSLATNLTDYATATKQDLQTAQLQTINSLTPSVYDYISLSYTGTDLTGVVFKNGGSGGTTVSTLTLGYTGGNLTSVTKS